MKKYLYLVYVSIDYEGDYVSEKETKAFESLDDAKAYQDYLQQKQKEVIFKGKILRDEVVITKIEHVTLK